ncbi:Spo0B domain-containing protein [Peribacillus kribbensis]|uniref:Spo0B domain-containing protein n=1 Tax=Peribacillus kribbensis TaxID=356658 RepID=UPI000407D62D|nr:Spo0B domain-containing protein [Peribacillus kribbensis]
MRKEWKITELMRHSRHDWLNRIQLIKGNLELNKVDRAKAIIEEIIIESKAEAMLSSLNMPLYAELLMTANWQEYPFKVEYEILDVENGCPSIDRELSFWTRQLFEEITLSLDPFAESLLMISIYKEHQNMRFSYELQGNITSEENLRALLLDCKTECLDITIKKFEESELSFEISKKPVTGK